MSDTHPLKNYRTTEKLTQGKLGKLLGVDENTVARWERGETLPQKKFRQKIATECGISAAQLAAHLKINEVAQ